MFNNIKDILVDIGLGCIKEKIANEKEERIVRDRLRKYIDRQCEINFHCTMQEELDFEGLAEYIQNDLIDDVKIVLFGNREERAAARSTIISKADLYSQAHTALSRRRAIKLTETAIEILKGFFKSKVNRELKFIAAQIEDTVLVAISDQTVNLQDSLVSSEERITEQLNAVIRDSAPTSITNNVKLIRDGNIGEVEENISTFMNALGSAHTLYPYYCYSIKSGTHLLYSKPTTRDAIQKYPPKISCTGTVQVNGEFVENFDWNTIDYANRHQLPIVLNIETARKYLGNEIDPIQHEAEELVGESIVLQPKPFPPAFPCSISLDGDVVYDYVLFRTEEILDDNTIIISNREQQNSPFLFKISANLDTQKTSCLVNTVNPSNEELLRYLIFLKRASSGATIVIKVLSIGEELARGQLGELKYEAGFETLDAELDFLDKVVSIEKHFGVRIDLPSEICCEDFETISYLSSLIKGEENVGLWTKLEFALTLTEELKRKISEMDDALSTLSYVGSINVSLYNRSYEVSVIRTFETVRVNDIERLKLKADVLDVGDEIKISYLPGEGSSGTWRDMLDTETEMER